MLCVCNFVVSCALHAYIQDIFQFHTLYAWDYVYMMANHFWIYWPYCVHRWELFVSISGFCGFQHCQERLAEERMGERERAKRGHIDGSGWFMEVGIIIEMPSVFAWFKICSHRQLFTLPHKPILYVNFPLFGMAASKMWIKALTHSHSHSHTRTR